MRRRARRPRTSSGSSLDSEGVGGRWFDGLSSRPVPVVLRMDGDELHLRGEGVDRRVARRDVAVVRTGPGYRLDLSGAGACEIDAGPGADDLASRLGHRTSLADRLARTRVRVALVVAAFVLLMAALHTTILPWLADRIAAHAPRSWDVALGKGVLKNLDARRVLTPSLVPQVWRREIAARFATLRFPSDLPEIRVDYRQAAAPNAFALPDGTVLLTDELVDLADGDWNALAIVLAHEAGHVAHRHTMRAIARQVMSTALMSWYLGDFSNGIAVAASGLGRLRYSREDEREADDYALRAARASGLSTRGAATLFRKLESEASARAVRKDRAQAPLRIPEYLSTHPDTDDRIRLFERD